MLLAFGGTDIGLTRENNQDYYVCGSLTGDVAYAVICDGMGGEYGGEIASSLAAGYAKTIIERDIKRDLTENSLRSILASIISGANAVVYDKSTTKEELSKMGTTIVIAVCIDNTVYCAWVGDSRAYILSEENARQITTDHTVVQLLIDIGEISKEDAENHPKKHYITRAVGVADTIESDFIVETLKEDEILLLCSDGLYNNVDTEDFYRYAKKSISKGNIKPLINAANKGGGIDNITAAVIVKGGE